MQEEGDDLDSQENKRLTHGRRLDLLEKWSRSHAKTIGEFALRLEGMGKEINQLSEWKMNRLIIEAREEERDKYLQNRLTAIEDGILGMKNAFSKVAWIAAGTLIPAMIIGLALILVFGPQVLQTIANN